ncbi:10744_t:CDS:1 [Paraglomus brasilianum]|uniref:Large ribosomal subunit protein uL30m n=1 Tax=Paraglomus brasilianum TaxID=144538 RepID=A0A9N9FD41_9GLOM|nr:10744_t:CDS:1 [Paraglomus brasilianum]
MSLIRKFASTRLSLAFRYIKNTFTTCSHHNGLYTSADFPLRRLHQTHEFPLFPSTSTLSRFHPLTFSKSQIRNLSTPVDKGFSRSTLRPRLRHRSRPKLVSVLPPSSGRLANGTPRNPAAVRSVYNPVLKRFTKKHPPSNILPRIDENSGLGFFKITLRRSVIGISRRLRRVVRALGFVKLHQTVYHAQTPYIAGMILRIKELVEVENVDKKPEKKEKRVVVERGYVVIKRQGGQINQLNQIEPESQNGRTNKIKNIGTGLGENRFLLFDDVDKK